MATPESEYRRVVRHETGHTLGFPHEHMRAELVNRIDPAKAIAYFAAADGWSAQMVQEQVLTPLSAASIRGTPNADQDSIMCYQLPGSITKDGQPIRGGVDIDPDDQAFSGKLYPLGIDPPAPPPPPPPGPAPTRLFQVTINRAVPKGGMLTLSRLPVAVPVGKYDFAPSGGAREVEAHEGEASL